MRNASQAYAETSASEVYLCAANYPGCTQEAHHIFTCQAEGVQIRLCSSCRGSWQLRVRSDAERLSTRCPACEALALGGAAPRRQQPSTALPLGGAAAQAITAAMHAEGLLEDVRDRVLRRLASEAPWLEDVRPPDPSYLGSAAAARRSYEATVRG